MTATTALTAQNTLGVVDIHYTPPDFVRKLIDAVGVSPNYHTVIYWG
jgi:hydroxymethylpyrimidine/phosphomethylpyrimidine kinase